MALAAVLMDLKAARPFAGFLDVTSHHFCFLCSCWHKAHLGRTDFENWSSADENFLRKGAELWRNVGKVDNRKAIEQLYGTRDSEFWRLPYWNPCLQLLIDPMHCVDLGEDQRFARDALGLDNPDSAAKQTKKPVYIAFYHDFTPPPPLSTITTATNISAKSIPSLVGRLIDLDDIQADDQYLNLLEWPQLSSTLQEHRSQRASNLRDIILTNSTAFQGVHDIHNELSGKLEDSRAAKSALKQYLNKRQWTSLAYVCNDLMVFPEEVELEIKHLSLLSQSLSRKGLSKKDMAQALADWVRAALTVMYSTNNLIFYSAQTILKKLNLYGLFLFLQIQMQ